MNEIEDVISFYKLGMSCSLKIASYKISVELKKVKKRDLMAMKTMKITLDDL